MESINTIINVITRNGLMATIDLKDPYYSLAISGLYQKFLKFKWKDKLYCFTCFLNGLGSCPTKFTKIYEVPITPLHFENVPVILMTILLKETLFQYVEKTCTKQCLFYDELGFAINLVKPQVVLTQRIRILGFVTD